MSKKLQRNLFLLLSGAMIFASCDSSSSGGGGGTTPVEAELASDIPGNINTVFTPGSSIADIPGNIATVIASSAPVADIPGDINSTGGFTFFNFETGSTVDDSLSADWDIAFSQTTVIANSGNGGGIQLVQTAYADVTEAPTSGYGDSDGTWYTYDGANFAIYANEGQTLVVQTADGNYAKVEILSYYEGNPDVTSAEFLNLGTRPASRYFTFNYTIQTDGSTNFVQEDVTTYYDLETGQTVDESSSAWDIGFSETTIVANTANGGGIQLVTTAFADVAEAPASGYGDSDGTWYTYDGANFAIYANEGQTLVVQTAEGNYAKVEMLSYYEGNPDVTSAEFLNLGTRPASRYFTFNYSIQTDGSTALVHVDTYTYFDLETGTVVADDASSQWDIAFASTTILANSENGGGVAELDISFENFTEAPVDGYAASSGAWYTYTGEAPSGAQHAVLPVDGMTLAFLTPDGNYAKVRMISYYEGNPDVESSEFIDLATRPTSRYFTFEYAIQTDGSTSFE